MIVRTTAPGEQLEYIRISNDVHRLTARSGNAIVSQVNADEEYEPQQSDVAPNDHRPANHCRPVDANRMLRLAASGFEVLQALKETIGKSAIEMNAKPQVGGLQRTVSQPGLMTFVAPAPMVGYRRLARAPANAAVDAGVLLNRRSIPFRCWNQMNPVTLGWLAR